MARLPKANSDGTVEVEVQNNAAVKQIIRYIARSGAGLEAGAKSVLEIDAYLTSFVEQGYELVNTHYLGENPEGYGVLYILVRYA